MGGRAAEVAVISLGGMVASESIRVGGDEMDQAIIVFAEKEYSLMLGERTAEEIKMAIGSACPSPEEPYAEIRGRNLVSGLPKTVVISAGEVRHAIQGPVSAIVDIVKTALDKSPPELAGDVMDRGIALTGGGALLRGLMSGCATRQGCRSSWPTIRWSRSCSARANALRTSMLSSRCWYGQAPVAVERGDCAPGAFPSAGALLVMAARPRPRPPRCAPASAPPASAAARGWPALVRGTGRDHSLVPRHRALVEPQKAKHGGCYRRQGREPGA